MERVTRTGRCTVTRRDPALRALIEESRLANRSPRGFEAAAERTATMPTAHMIHGYLGAGKTTFARRLEQELPAIRFTHDEWMARLYGVDPPVEQFADHASRVSAQIDSLWPRCLQLGLDVVLDLNFWTRRGRDATRMKARSLGAAVRLYSLACPDEVAWHRIERRNAAPGGSGLFIARSTFEVLRARFEPLDPDEEREEIASLK